VFNGRTLQPPASGFTISNADGVSGNPTFALNDDLAAIEAIATNAMAVRTGTSTWTTRTLTGTSNQITVTNGTGVSGNPTLSFPATFFASGTFTPTIVGTAVTGTGTYSIQVGRYQRIGNTVYVVARAVWSAHTGSGNMQMNGLPFNATSTTNETQSLPFATARAANTAFTNAQVWGILLAGQAVVQPVSFANVTGTVVLQALPAAGELIFQGYYEV
jgi:hypothetical protein